jgi:heat-inducible transcriptional repressor
VLSERQELLLRKVVEGHLAGGQPVGSKMLAADIEVEWGPSTVRHELAVLEEHGLLAHPHTSAGRVPTDAGYRYFVDRIVAGQQPSPPEALTTSLARLEIDDAIRVMTETLSRVTSLLAIVSAPPIETTTIRHVEVLLLQPQVVMTVVITSAGGVTKRLFTSERPVDPGLVSWAGSYLNERLTGMALGARRLASRLDDPSLSAVERTFIRQLEPAFTDLNAAEDSLYVDGTSRLLGGGRSVDVADLNALMEMIEQRVGLLELLRDALDERGVYVRIGHENEIPALRTLAVVAAGYGPPGRNLGTVSVIGPTRMDYATAIPSVREAANQLSRFVSDLYDG